MKKYILILSLLISSFVFSQDGVLDLSFANNGIYNPTNLNFTGSLLDLSVDFSNSIFISGNVVNSDNTKSIMVIKLLPDGEIDTSFGNNGYSYIHFSPTAFVSKNIVLENGKIILVGWINSNTKDFLIIGLNADGSLDPDFGDNGRVIIDSSYGDDRAFALVEHNNFLFIGGQLRNQDGKTDFSVVKMNYNGNLDPLFGINGIAKRSVPERWGSIRDLLITDSGDIVACGLLTGGSSSSNGFGDIAVVRFDQSGNIVSSFANNGLFKFQTNGVGCSIKNYENSFYITGHLYNSEIGRNSVEVLKIKNNGILDTSFNGIGFINFSGNGQYGSYYGGYSSILQDNNKLIIGGEMGFETDGIVFKRINADGTMDPDFGTNGSILFDFPGSGDNPNRSLSRQFNDKFLSLGLSYLYADNVYHLYLTRHNIDQSLSINDEEINSQDYTVFPNPASGDLFIKGPINEFTDGNIYDMTGKLILEFSLNAQENKIDIQNISAGIYFLQINNDHQIIVNMIIID
ncbi:T9SS type A sorting domain-containing protein [Bizionia paragorgiae]|uniref:T9SS type A sorting domain-containing protein n=1 Tax=Bizionia paragorgiae TaxID=283786 RepID=UPI003A8D21CF